MSNCFDADITLDKDDVLDDVRDRSDIFVRHLTLDKSFLTGVVVVALIVSFYRDSLKGMSVDT